MSAIIRTSLAAAAGLALLALSAGCASPERSRNLADPGVPPVALAQQVCSLCHGVTGNAVSPNFPNLAAQPEAYVAAQLAGFKGHGRRDPAGFEYMWGISRALSDEQVAGLAAYYAAQKPTPQPLEGDPGRARAGKVLFEGGAPDRAIPPCGTCHGDHGQGQATFPRLAGQHADYVEKQLRVFQRTDERPEGSVMKTIAHGLSDADVVNAAAYVQSLQP